MRLTPFTSQRNPWCRANSGCGPIVHRAVVKTVRCPPPPPTKFNPVMRADVKGGQRGRERRRRIGSD